MLAPFARGRRTAIVSEIGAAAGVPITVTGIGRVTIRPDVADVRIGAMVAAQTAAEARDRVAGIMTAVLTAVRARGAKDGDLQTSSLTVTPRTDYSAGSPRVTGYEATNAVAVVVRDLDQLSEIVDGAVAAGATSIEGPTFRLADPTEASATARRLAVEDAAERAATLAQAAGLQITGIASIGEAGARPIPVPRGARMMAMAEGAPSPIEVGTDEVRVEVEVTYLAG
jgi:uncharacterized protein